MACEKVIEFREVEIGEDQVWHITLVHENPRLEIAT